MGRANSETLDETLNYRRENASLDLLHLYTSLFPRHSEPRRLPARIRTNVRVIRDSELPNRGRSVGRDHRLPLCAIGRIIAHGGASDGRFQ